MKKIKRFEELDFARVIPLLFLPIVHTYEQFTNYGALSDSLVNSGKILLYLCALGPSIFMILLGANIVFSRNSTPKKLFKRGVLLIGLFFIHNIIRYIIPVSLFTLATGENLMMDGIIGFFTSDILFFAGIAFMFFALMKKCNFSSLNIFLITLLLLSMHTIIMPEEMPPSIMAAIMGNFVHVTHHSAFAAMEWLIFPAIGYFFGEMLIKYRDNNRLDDFYRNIGISSAVILVSLIVSMSFYKLDWLLIGASAANNYLVDFFNVILDTLIAFIWFSIFYFIYNWLKKKLSNKFSDSVITLSKAILWIYLIQWVLVTISLLIFGILGYADSHALDVFDILIVSSINLVITIYLAIKINTRIETKKLKKTKNNS